MINWAIMRHPLNWVIVLLMTTIGMFALGIITHGIAPASTDQSQQ